MHTIFVIFGATGDLAKRKLFGALARISQDESVGSVDVIGVGRKNFDDASFASYVDAQTEGFVPKSEAFSQLLKRLRYSRLEIDQERDYLALRETIVSMGRPETQVIFYLSISPELFPVFVDHYRHVAIPGARVVFEKPFGTDLQTARALNARIREVFDESQIYRIDHYVGKEAIQNILAFRFANAIIEPIWNSKYIDNIQITASESIGVGDRGGYYDVSGALRDMVQNHLLQILSLVVMDPPSDLDAVGIRQEKLKVFRGISLSDRYESDTVFGQYAGYLSEKDVAPNSRTETFVAMKLFVDSWNFSGVPIYLRTGKCLSGKSTRIVVEFKDVPHALFAKNGAVERNRIILEVQPNEGIDIHFNVKQDGNSKEVERVRSRFEKELGSKEAYEKLLHDVLLGDATLFTSWEMLEETWRIVDDLVHCKDQCPIVHPYEAGTDGPAQACDLLARDNRKWYA